MRHIQTLTNRQLATALASREEDVNPNVHPSAGRVGYINDRLDTIVAEINGDNAEGPQWDRYALRGEQSAVVQDLYVARRNSGEYRYENEEVSA